MNNPSLFDGEGDDEGTDKDARLENLLHRVWAAMSDGGWWLLSDLARVTHASEASVSARLRDFRKPRFGGHEVHRQLVEPGLYQYRLAPTEVGLLDGKGPRSAKADARKRLHEWVSEREARLAHPYSDWANVVNRPIVGNEPPLLASDIREMLR
jgi:hypothetical protein